MADPSEIKADAPATRFRVGLRFSLLLVALATVALTAAAVHVPWNMASRDNVGDMVRQLNREIVRNVSREVGRLLDDAVTAQETVLNALRAGVIDIDDKTKRDDLFFSILKANQHFSWVSFGFPNGSFAGVQRRDPRNYRVAWSAWDTIQGESKREEAYFFRDDQGHYIHTQTKTRPSDYAAFTRQWFKRAVAKPETHIWSDVYIFANSGQPGLNTAITFMREGSLVGVVSVAIELRRMADYLRELKIAEHGKAFIVNRKGEMIAFEDTREVAERVSENEEASRLRTIGAGTAPLLRVAAQGIRSNKLSLADLKGPVDLRVTGGDGAGYYVSLAPSGFQDWIIGTVVPEADFTARIEENLRALVYTLAGAILLIALLSIIISHRFIIQPLRRMMALTRSVEKFELEKMVHRPSNIVEIDQLSRSLNRMSIGLGAFRRYLSADLVRTLLASGIEAKAGGERRTLTVMFTDLEGFTAATERLGHRIMPLLNRYLDALTRVVIRNGGTVDKYIGDSIMAFWNAPMRNEEHALAACRSALECAAAMKGLREAGPNGEPALPFNLRIGVNTGRVIVGNIGSEEKIEYTVIGDPVNLANRLEGLNKAYGTGILIGQTTYEEVKYDTIVRRVDSVAVKGREAPSTVYELLAIKDDKTAESGFEWVPVYERAYEAFQRGDWRAALDGFRAVITARGSDGPSAHFARLCEERLAAPPTAPNISLLTTRGGA
jgi:adenylate cyclase